MKFCSPDSVSIIRCYDINHLNECTGVFIKFGANTPLKSKVVLINAIFHDVAAHHGLFPLRGMDMLPANMEHCIQLHLQTTASVLNEATATIVSLDANDWNDITWGWVSPWALVVAMT